jgi:UDP-N-acetyl-2-amino-2-deoxyglucuronate dehydrogenase
MTIGFGIVGCGMISRFHARAIQEIPEARLVGCASSRRESAEKFGSEFQCTAFPTIGELVARDDIQIVSICTPSGAHLEPALLAAKSGKHLVIEKPLEITLERCDQIIEACETARVKLATIFPSRFHECWQELKRAIDGGRFGRIALGSAYVKWFRTQQYYDQGNWRGTWELDGGGALMNQAIHTIDLLQWLMGPVESVSAMTATLAHQRIEVEDVAVASLKFRSGALGSIEATTASFPGMLKKIEIHGDAGSAAIEEEDIKHWQFAKPLLEDDVLRQKFSNFTSSGGGASNPAAIGHTAHRKLFSAFINSLRDGKPSMLEGIEGRKSVEIIRAIYDSARAGKRVEMAAR